MKTIAEFAEACENKTHEEIYELFEDDISQKLRDRIYSFSEIDAPEPVRSALNGIGMIYHVQSLKDY
jgi:hypothetical protein